MTKQQKIRPFLIVMRSECARSLVDLLEPEGYKVFAAQARGARSRLLPRQNDIILRRRHAGDERSGTMPAAEERSIHGDDSGMLASAVRKEDAAHLEGFAAG